MTIFFSEAFKTTDNLNNKIDISSLDDNLKDAEINQNDIILIDENNTIVYGDNNISQYDETHGNTDDLITENIVTDYELVMPYHNEI